MTYDEAERILDRLAADLDPTLVGDVRPYAISWIKDKLKEHEELTKCDI